MAGKAAVSWPESASARRPGISLPARPQTGPALRQASPRDGSEKRMESCRCRFLCRRLDGVNDVLISGTAAEIAGQFAPYGLAIARPAAPDHVDRRHDHSRCTESALQRMVFAKPRLYRMQRAVPRDAFDRGHGGAVRLAREHRAGFDCPAIDVNNAGAALAGVAADMCSGQPERLAQEID